MQEEFFKRLSDTHPFITVCHYAEQDYVGIIQNRDDSVTTFYDYGSIIDAELRSKFLELGEVWWWGSNRIMPIHLFLKSEWALFKPFLRTFSTKSVEILHGPVCSMNEMYKKKTKRKSITLVRKLP